MKKILSLFLLICLIFSMAVPFISTADDEKADEVVSGGDLTRLNVPKTTYEYGEPIIVSAIGTGYDWVGIYTMTAKNSMFYKYVGAEVSGGAGSGVEFDMIKDSVKNMDVPDVLPCGEYIIRLQPNDSSDFNLNIAWVKIKVVEGDGPVDEFEGGGDLTRLNVPKTTYEYGEPIIVSAIGTGYDWVGIYKPDGKYSMFYKYIGAEVNGGAGSGVEFDLIRDSVKNMDVPDVLPCGEYIIRLQPNDSSDFNLNIAWVKIKVVEGDGPVDEFEGGGDLTRLNVPKTTYEYGEPIIVSAIGTGYDWVGLYKPDGKHSMYYKYIGAEVNGGAGSGVEFDMIKDSVWNYAGLSDVLPCGEYIIRLQPNDSSDFNLNIAWVRIKVVPPENPGLPEKPIDATYTLEDPTSGYAAGTLTVKLKENVIAQHVIPYWGDDNGKLEGYTALAKFKAKSTELTYKFPSKMIIPTGATKLYLYTANYYFEESEECYVIDLPKGCAFKDQGDPIVRFQIVSDTHVVNQNEHASNTNYVNMLKDIVNMCPDSMGIFIVGDMVDTGYATEYQKMAELYKSVNGAPPQFIAIGNHDMFALSHEQSIKLFLKNATLPDGSHPEKAHYDFWLNGYHFVFLGNDKLVSMLDCTLNDDTLAWLDDTLAKDRDANRPTFLFIHQGIYNTVAGTLSGEGWDGIADSSEIKLKAILKKYPEVIMFSGHSHWNLDSNMTMLPGTSNFPTFFNTSSVSYLFTGYNVTAGEREEGSEGYYIEVYEDKILVLGRDFTTNSWRSSAQFVVEYEDGTGPLAYTVTLENQGIGNGPDQVKAVYNGKLTLPVPTAEGYEFMGWFTDADCTEQYDENAVVTGEFTLYAKWEPIAEPPQTGDATVYALVLAVAALIGMSVVVKRKVRV
ncbi:MAG: hypothetical protein E7675_03420 [Ruminococcaceae bacterium]|nr:hypothetical protein [Oscillospiraceae bacterium]